MKTITETLELQHRAIEHEIATFTRALSERNADGVRAGLDRLETILINHLRLENTEFYPALLVRAEGDVMHETVTLFHQNLARISEGVLGFFGRWTGPFNPKRVDALQPDWIMTHKLLESRLRDEDKILHPIHRRLFPAPETGDQALAARVM